MFFQVSVIGLGHLSGDPNFYLKHPLIDSRQCTNKHARDSEASESIDMSRHTEIRMS